MRKVLAAFSLAALAAVPALAAPSADAVLRSYHDAVGGKAWDNKATLKTEYAYAGQGMTGKTASLADLASGRFVDSYAIGPLTGANGYDGAHAWAKDQSGTVTSQDGGEAVAAAANESYRDANLWWRPDHGGATVAGGGQKTEAGVTYDVLTITPKGGKPFEAWFEAKTHLLVRIHEMLGSAPTTTTFSDYRAFGGVLLPQHQLIGTGNARYDQTQTLISATFLPAQDATAYVAPKVVIADATIANGAHETSFPFRLVNNHIYGAVKINGKGPYVFIFDTGGVNLVSPSLAKALALPIEGHVEARGAGAGTMDAGFTKVGEIGLGGASIKGQVFFSMPLDSMANVEGVEMPGMVGFETFRRFVTRIDYGTQTITLIDPKSFNAKDAGAPVPLKFDGNVPEVDATYDGITGKFQIDTGARSSLTLTTPFVEKNKLRAKTAKGVEATTGWGVGGPTRSFVERGAALEIGTVVVPSTITLLSTDSGGAMASAQLAGNIGGGVLKRFVVTFDYEHNVMYLNPVAGPTADLDTFDRSGLWINRDPKGLVVVDVTAHAPGDMAGLKAGDIITAVDGRPATGIDLPSLRYRLRNDAPGSVVVFAVRRGEAAKSISVTLRDLI